MSSLVSFTQNFNKNITKWTEEKSNQTFPALYHIVYAEEKGDLQDFQGDFQDFVSIIEFFIIYFHSLFYLQIHFTGTFLFWNFCFCFGLCLSPLLGGHLSDWANGWPSTWQYQILFNKRKRSHKLDWNASLGLKIWENFTCFQNEMNIFLTNYFVIIFLLQNFLKNQLPHHVQVQTHLFSISSILLEIWSFWDDTLFFICCI